MLIYMLINNDVLMEVAWLELNNNYLVQNKNKKERERKRNRIKYVIIVEFQQEKKIEEKRNFVIIMLYTVASIKNR